MDESALKRPAMSTRKSSMSVGVIRIAVLNPISAVA
jgi:hypothetical protein